MNIILKGILLPLINDITKEISIFTKQYLFKKSTIIQTGTLDMELFLYKVLFNGLNDSVEDKFKIDHNCKEARLRRIPKLGTITTLKLDTNNNYIICYTKVTRINDVKYGYTVNTETFYLVIGPRFKWYYDNISTKYARKKDDKLSIIQLNSKESTARIPKKYSDLHFGFNEIDNLIEYLKKFCDYRTEKLYSELGKIYKTGILLHGEPGTGKSSLATILASELNVELKVLTVETINENILSTNRTLSIILIDEIDRFFKDKPTEDDLKRINTLLALLDSPSSPQNVIFIATTNNIDNLDKAILRDGRFDFIYETHNISKEDAILMCTKLKYPVRLLEQESFPINPSYLQNKITQYRVNKLFNKQPKGISHE